MTFVRAPLHSPVLHMRPCALLQPVRGLGVVTKINKKPEQGRDPRHSSPQSPSIFAQRHSMASIARKTDETPTQIGHASDLFVIRAEEKLVSV